MAPRKRRMLSKILVVLLGLLVLLLMLGLRDRYWPSPEHPDIVSRPALEPALERDPSLPLDAAHTDVVLVAVCTLRRDRMSLFGGSNPTTPFLDQLARQGVVFDDHLAQAPWTRPSMGALFTGRWPRALRLDSPGGGDRFSMKLSEHHTLLSEAMAARGYATVSSVANPNLKAGFGFAQGFEQYEEPRGTYGKGVKVRGARKIVNDVLKMAASVPLDRRLYARLVVLDSHKPHRYRPHHLQLMKGPRQVLRTYDAALRGLDAELARLYVELKRSRPNLLFVLAADHGEGLRLPRHHGPGHGKKIYRTTLQTPWILHHPALPEPGRRVQGLSMNIDVVPTVLDLLGQPADFPVDGRSQAAAVLGQAERASHEIAFAETFFRHKHASTAWDGRYQLVRRYRGPGVEGESKDALYTAKDWQAEKDVIDSRPEDAERLSRALDAWEAEMLRLQVLEGPGEEVEMDEGTRAELGALGYLTER